MSIVPVIGYKDNYIWTLVHGNHAVVVDPGEGKPIAGYLNQNALTLHGILITHHHADHIDGIQLLEKTWQVPVYASAFSPLQNNAIFHPLNNGNCISFPELNLQFSVIATPGHTDDSVSFYAPNLHAVFTGDCLFSGGCGRVFEGTPSQMLQSLDALAALPDDTNLYPGHDYALSNIKFAQAVEPHSKAIQNRLAQILNLAAEHKPSSPTTLAEEKAFNPFLRIRDPKVIQAAEQHAGNSLNSPAEVFATLRNWKNSF